MTDKPELGNLKIPIELHARLKTHASSRRIGLNELAARMLEAGLGEAGTVAPELPGASFAKSRIIQDIEKLLSERPSFELYLRRQVSSFRQISDELKKEDSSGQEKRTGTGG